MTFLFLTAELTNSATGHCAKTVANELAKRGHCVHMLSATRKRQDTVEEDGHLVIHEVQGNRYRWFWRDCLNSGNRIKKALGIVLSTIHKITVQIKGVFTVVPVSNDINVLFKNASTIIEKEDIQCVIPVVNPRESVIVANKLYKKYNIPYIPYYLDSIFGNIGLRFLPDSVNKKKALQYEDKWLQDAKAVIMMQSVKGLYDGLNVEEHPYLSKIVFMDIPLLTIYNSTTQKQANPMYDGQVAILFIGTMPNRIRDPRYVFQLADKVAKDNVHFYFAGRSDYMNDLDTLMKRNGNIHFLGEINHDDIPNYVEGVHLLLNIGNTIPGMLPSKVFEYMSYKKPIISTIKHSKDLSVSYLEKYGAAYVVDESKPLDESVKETRKYINQQMKGEFDINISELIEKDGALYLNTPQCFCEKIESIFA